MNASVLRPRMTLDVADALALIAKRSCGRAELSIAAILTVIFDGRDHRGGCDGYSDWTRHTIHYCDHGVCGRIYTNDAGSCSSDLSARAVRCDRY
jgi:hypothetical protein